MKITRKEFENYLNGFEVPDSDCKSAGGMIPDRAKYGSWLRRNDPIGFDVSFGDYKREK